MHLEHYYGAFDTPLQVTISCTTRFRSVFSSLVIPCLVSGAVLSLQMNFGALAVRGEVGKGSKSMTRMCARGFSEESLWFMIVHLWICLECDLFLFVSDSKPCELVTFSQLKHTHNRTPFQEKPPFTQPHRRVS